MSTDKRAVLRRVPMFADLADDDCDRVIAVLKAKRGGPGEILFREGEPGTSLIVVLEGELVASVATAEGAEEVARMGVGEVVGELGFLDSEPRSATVQAPNGAIVLEFSRESFASLKRDAPRVAAALLRNVLADMARRLRALGHKLVDDSGGSSPQSMRSPKIAAKRVRPVTGPQLRSFAPLASYGAEDLDLLAHIGQLRGFSSGESLMTEGAEGDGCYFVLSGSVDVFRSSLPTPVASLGAGSIVGQLALIDRAPRSASVVARGEVVALEIQGALFSNLARASSSIALRVQEQVAIAAARQLRAGNRKFAELAAARAMGPNSMRLLETVDDWGEAQSGELEIELAAAPRSIRR